MKRVWQSIRRDLAELEAADGVGAVRMDLLFGALALMAFCAIAVLVAVIGPGS